MHIKVAACARVRVCACARVRAGRRSVRRYVHVGALVWGRVRFFSACGGMTRAKRALWCVRRGAAWRVLLWAIALALATVRDTRERSEFQAVPVSPYTSL